MDIYHTLREYSPNISVYDPWADAAAVKKNYGIELAGGRPEDLSGNFDAVILCVAHSCFLDFDVRSLLADREKGVVYDVKGILERTQSDGRL